MQHGHTTHEDGFVADWLMQVAPPVSQTLVLVVTSGIGQHEFK